jgi:SNF2 family DNA or RNA helicase
MNRPELRPHQVRALEYCLKNQYVIVGLDPRLGKSRVAIETREKFGLNCLVICPGYLVDNWKIEIKKWVDRPIITTFHRGKDLFDVVDSDYVVISYSLAQKAPWLFEWADMVVLDEAPAIKSMKAKRSQFIHKEIFENGTARVLMLTGTPIKNRVQEFYSLLALTFYNPNTPQGRFLEQYPDEISFADQFSHRQQYVMKVGGRFVTVVQWNGLQNRDELRKWLKGRYIRIRDTDVLDMPPVSTKPVLIRDEEDPELLNAFDSYFSDGEHGSVKPQYKAEAALRKVPFTVNYVKDLLEQKECCLVYSDHVASAEAIAEKFGVEAITGKMPARKRGSLADEFQAGQGKVLVATIGSLKEGKDLFRAHDVVFNDICWVPGDLKQVVNRIRVVGKKTPCTAHRIFGSPQDEYIASVLDEKIDTIERAT